MKRALVISGGGDKEEFATRIAQYLLEDKGMQATKFQTLNSTKDFK